MNEQVGHLVVATRYIASETRLLNCVCHANCGTVDVHQRPMGYSHCFQRTMVGCHLVDLGVGIFEEYKVVALPLLY